MAEAEICLGYGAISGGGTSRTPELVGGSGAASQIDMRTFLVSLPSVEVRSPQ